MHWPPTIRNYMRRVRSKYQHIPPPFVLLTHVVCLKVSVHDWLLNVDLANGR